LAVPLTAISFSQYLQAKDFKMYPKVTPMRIIYIILLGVMYFAKSLNFFEVTLLLEITFISSLLYDFVNKK
jgi:hypothetical protein